MLEENLFYKLEGKNPVPCSANEMGELLTDDNKRRVAFTKIGKDIEVSTVFLAMRHNLMSEGDPVLFETMVFAKGKEHNMRRYTNWKDAEEGHRKFIKELGAKTTNRYEFITKYAKVR